MKEINLCGRRRCCPVLKRNKHGYFLYEDFGGGVIFELPLGDY